MALKGLEELVAKIRKDENLSTDSVEAELNKILPESWVPKSKFNEQLEDAKQLKAKIAENEKIVKTLTEKANLSDELKKQVLDAQNNLKLAEEKYAEEKKQYRISTAVEAGMLEAHAFNPKMASKMVDAGKLVLAEDGSVTGLKEQIEALKKSDAYLFKPEDDGGGNGGSGGKTGPQVFMGGQRQSGNGGNGTDAGLQALMDNLAGLPAKGTNGK